MLQRALANGKRAGGGAATSVRVALPIHDFRRPSSRARHAFREIPLALVADTRPTPSSTQKKPARPKKDGPVRTQRCVARARPAPRRRVPAPARVSGAPAVPGTSAHFSQSRTIPRLTPPSPASATPALSRTPPSPAATSTRSCPAPARRTPTRSRSPAPRPRRLPPAVSVAIHSASTPRTTPWCATWCTTRKRRRRLGWRAPRRNRRRLPRARRRRDVPRPLPRPPSSPRAARRTSSSDSTPSVSSPSWSVPSSVSLRRWWSARRFAIV